VTKEQDMYIQGKIDGLREAADDLWRTDVAGYNGPAIARLRAHANAEEKERESNV